ncbi:hypothetical protein Dalk_2718 [Desulfatibacillum aliphaticivorans]|uniref:Uncharacterized protein n=1 Tax=Desulfatibacillum aliphaticivorans TaxID=218208 RepID=B8FKN8_DESAL|nr:hypothetical protein Dalk_2718 [Desulfatibacillum aliphaticivorans]
MQALCHIRIYKGQMQKPGMRLDRNGFFMQDGLTILGLRGIPYYFNQVGVIS